MKDTFTLWALARKTNKEITWVSCFGEGRKGALKRKHCDVSVVELECRIVQHRPKKPRKPKTFTAHGLAWIPHTPGDPMPCDGEKQVRIFIRHEREHGYTAGRYKAKSITWKKRPVFEWAEIIGWNFAP